MARIVYGQSSLSIHSLHKIEDSQYSWTNGAMWCDEGNTKKAICKITNAATVTQVSACLMAYQAMGAAFSPTYSWQKDEDSALGWVPSAGHFLLTPFDNMLKEYYFQASFWTAFAAAVLSVLISLGSEGICTFWACRCVPIHTGVEALNMLVNVFYLTILSTLLSPWSCTFDDC